MTDPIPTANEVIAHLNERFAARGAAFRIDSLHVLPYVNPMWLANWALESTPSEDELEIVEEEVADARWRFPQILGDW
ncbi:MAG TPA: hypothetical protein VGJ81_00290 [Thermoanaerobaculia bacterium]|jgi:hypothetical protein